MNKPKTLIELSGSKAETHLKDSVLVLIDYQNEYLDGALPLFEVEKAVRGTRAVLDLARKQNIPVIHVVHRGSPGLFDLNSHGGQIIPALKPVSGETIIEKSFPNSFAGTELDATIKSFSGKNHLIVAGLMTHMCLSSTVSSAIDHGYTTTIVADTTTTRDLKGAGDETVPADRVRAAALATLKDRFAHVVNSVADLS